MAQKMRCYLMSVENPLKKIYLPDQREVQVGRNRVCDIRDYQVSRVQLVCRADAASGKLLVRTTGANKSACNGYALRKSRSYYLKHGDLIQLIYGRHPFKVVFDSDRSAGRCSPTIGVKKQNDPTNDTPQPEAKKMAMSRADGTDEWEHIDKGALLIFTSGDCVSRPKIAGFDIDGTIIKTKSGARFPKDKDDWILLFPLIPKKLKELHDSGFKIVFFTNQLNLGRDSAKIREFKVKIQNIIAKLTVPIQVFIATSRSQYRKPVPGMWNVLCNNKNDDIPVDLGDSLYVGDAAGREKNWAPKRNKDHSVCDRLFALNIGIKFYTPEEYFLGAPKVKHVMPEFDPTNLKLIPYPDYSNNSGAPEVIIMVGAQGSGKSNFCKSKLVPQGYVYINRDELGAWQKCVKKLEESLKNKMSAVVDNTNPDKGSRAKYIEVANKFGVQCRCFVMSLPLKHSKHNNKFRELVDDSHATVSEILINSFNKNFQEPDLSEGYKEIVKIPFVPDFKEAEHEKLYKLYLLES